MPPLEVVVYLSCKLFANKLCVIQEGVPLLRPVVTTPNIWCETPGKQGV